MAEIFQLPIKDKHEGDKQDYLLPSGFPSPAMDAMKPRISLDAWLIQNPLSTFFFYYQSDALLQACVPPGSWLQVDRSLTPENMSMIVCSVDSGDLTVGFYKKEGNQCWLLFANKKYKPVPIHDCLEFLFWGVVVYIISDAKKIKSCLD